MLWMDSLGAHLDNCIVLNVACISGYKWICGWLVFPKICGKKSFTQVAYHPFLCGNAMSLLHSSLFVNQANHSLTETQKRTKGTARERTSRETPTV